MADETTATDGGQLRAKLEETLAENNQLRQQVATFRATTLIQEKGFTLVTPDDLADVSPEDLETKAAELEDQRKQAEVETVRRVYERSGLSGDELEQAVASVFGGQTPQPAGTVEADAVNRARRLADVPSTPVSNISTDQLHGYEAILAGVKG